MQHVKNGRFPDKLKITYVSSKGDYKLLFYYKRNVNTIQLNFLYALIKNKHFINQTVLIKVSARFSCIYFIAFTAFYFERMILVQRFENIINPECFCTGGGKKFQAVMWFFGLFRQSFTT